MITRFKKTQDAQLLYSNNDCAYLNKKEIKIKNDGVINFKRSNNARKVLVGISCSAFLATILDFHLASENFPGACTTPASMCSSG